MFEKVSFLKISFFCIIKSSVMMFSVYTIDPTFKQKLMDLKIANLVLHASKMATIDLIRLQTFTYVVEPQKYKKICQRSTLGIV